MQNQVEVTEAFRIVCFREMSKGRQYQGLENNEW